MEHCAAFVLAISRYACDPVIDPMSFIVKDGRKILKHPQTNFLRQRNFCFCAQKVRSP